MRFSRISVRVLRSLGPVIGAIGCAVALVALAPMPHDHIYADYCPASAPCTPPPPQPRRRAPPAATPCPTATPPDTASPPPAAATLNGLDLMMKPPFVILPIIGGAGLAIALIYWILSMVMRPKQKPLKSVAVTHVASRPDYAAGFGAPPPVPAPPAAPPSAWADVLPQTPSTPPSAPVGPPAEPEAPATADLAQAPPAEPPTTPPAQHRPMPSEMPPADPAAAPDEPPDFPEPVDCY